ncbi:hypothetical protein B0H34DRAFT_719201 [Crassisporium funariophilum]|nr:hypothetical protein B0H34DRAFT_719201 [Crassisporium funariophilum]
MQSHFTKLRTMHKDLAALGQIICQDNFYTIVFGSLPSFYNSLISSLNGTAFAICAPRLGHQQGKENITFFLSGGGGKNSGGGFSKISRK